MLIGIGASLIAAPAIVRAGSLMKVKSFIEPIGWHPNCFLDGFGLIYGVVRVPGESDVFLRWRIRKTITEPYQHRAFLNNYVNNG